VAIFVYPHSNEMPFLSKYLLGALTILIYYLLHYNVLSSERKLFSPMSIDNGTTATLRPAERPQRHANAFILTSSCAGIRYNTTTKHLERSFPRFFHFYCYESLPLNDSRIHSSNITLLKLFSSSLVSTIQIWTYEIPKYASSEMEWSFFFEDDVNVVNPETAAPQISTWFNYTPILQELMHDEEVHKTHGLFYLGICGPIFNFTDRPLQATSDRNETLYHYKGYGYCGHALAFTTKRARLFWTEISSYRPASYDAGADQFIHEYCKRSGSRIWSKQAVAIARRSLWSRFSRPRNFSKHCA
jgi:hypothetical protein